MDRNPRGRVAQAEAAQPLSDPVRQQIPYTVFSHLNADKAGVYRAILRVFVTERARFVISLRPAEVFAALGMMHAKDPGADWTALAGTMGPKMPTGIDDVNAALKQLRAWGNLDDAQDNVEAATIEEYYLNRRLYQLSAAGEAAEQALMVFEDYLHRPGELQTTALHDIGGFLDALAPRLADEPLDAAKLQHLLDGLVMRFEQLTAREQSFMRGLQSTIELHGIGMEAFLAYKERIIEYLEKFIGELVIATGRISEAILGLESRGLERAFACVAERELADVVVLAPDAHDLGVQRWQQRWRGLRRWFIADDKPSQAELLRARARSAIPALLSAVTQINDRRASRADRAADFATLARWFAEAPDDAAAHRLWRTAFALSPARHLRINTETLAERDAAPENPRVSWLEASPVWLSPRLRKQGQNARRGQASATIDRTVEKEQLKELARKQAAEIERARQQLMQVGRCRLSELGPLDVAPFRLFLDLLGHALTRRSDRTGPIEVDSADGTLRIRLDPVPGGPVVTLETEIGNFHGRDHWLTISAVY